LAKGKETLFRVGFVLVEAWTVAVPVLDWVLALVLDLVVADMV
jgi:hypothetical protein